MDTDLRIVAADHPSLDGDVAAFVERLLREPRYFGPTARLQPKPPRSVVESLGARGGVRMAAVECGRIVGLARIDGHGRLRLAVEPERRGHGVATELGRAMVLRARALGYERIELRTSRGDIARGVGEELGVRVVEHAPDRIEVFLDADRAERSA